MKTKRARSWNPLLKRRSVVGFLDVESFQRQLVALGPASRLRFISFISFHVGPFGVHQQLQIRWKASLFLLFECWDFYFVWSFFFFQGCPVPAPSPSKWTNNLLSGYLYKSYLLWLSYLLLGLFVAFHLFLFFNERLCLIAFKCNYFVQISAAQRGSSLIKGGAQKPAKKPGE